MFKLFVMMVSFVLAASAFASENSQSCTAEQVNPRVAARGDRVVDMAERHYTRLMTFFDWGRAQNGWGYCYEYNRDGQVLNGGRPVDNWSCERVKPSHHDWGKANNGYGYCYQWTPYGVAMNEGQPVDNWSCERVRPSHYRWARANNGYTYCYQYTPYGVPMNEANPVSNDYCFLKTSAPL